MFVELGVALLLVAPWALEVEQFEDLFDTSVHLSRLHATTAVLKRALPLALHFDAVFTVQTVAAGALEREWRHDEFAETANKAAHSRLHPRSFINLL